VAVGAQLLSGCNGFFVYPGSTSTSTTGGTSSGDYAFISNSASGSTYIDGFQISSGTLVATTGSPAQLAFVPSAMVVTPNNNFLYVASASGGLYGYTIGSGGSLAVMNSGTELQSEYSASMVVSPNGNYLFSLNSDGLTIEEYAIGTSGGLTYESEITLSNVNTSLPLTAAGIAMAPSGEYFAVALGQAGFETYTFDQSTGGVSEASQTTPSSNTVGAYALAIDSNNDLYVAETGTVYAYSVNTSGIPNGTPVSTQSSNTGPFSIALKGTSYVYVGGENSSSSPIINTYANSSGVLSSATASVGPATVSALAVDNTGGYLVAAGFNATNGIQLFQIGSTGAITSVNSAASGTTTGVPTIIAMTH
jgi:6-phosphogluconolactonase